MLLRLISKSSTPHNIFLTCFIDDFIIQDDLAYFVSHPLSVFYRHAH
jgi:hypothetical protein